MMKHWKILAAASLIAFAMNTSFAGGIKSGAPNGWQLWGPLGDKYEMGIDPAESTPATPASPALDLHGLTRGVTTQHVSTPCLPGVRKKTGSNEER